MSVPVCPFENMVCLDVVFVLHKTIILELILIISFAITNRFEKRDISVVSHMEELLCFTKLYKSDDKTNACLSK